MNGLPQGRRSNRLAWAKGIPGLYPPGMPCQKMDLGNGNHAILCFRGQRPRAKCDCGNPHQYLCDAPARKGKRKTCNRKLCDGCRVKVGELDYCRSCEQQGPPTLPAPKTESVPHPVRSKASASQLSLFGGMSSKA